MLSPHSSPGLTRAEAGRLSHFSVDSLLLSRLVHVIVPIVGILHAIHAGVACGQSDCVAVSAYDDGGAAHIHCDKVHCIAPCRGLPRGPQDNRRQPLPASPPMGLPSIRVVVVWEVWVYFCSSGILLSFWFERCLLSSLEQFEASLHPCGHCLAVLTPWACQCWSTSCESSDVPLHLLSCYGFGLGAA